METTNQTIESLKAELEATRAREKELAAQIRQAGKTLRCEVGPSGGVMVKGLQRFPVTLYMNQWKQLFDNQEVIKAFIASNVDQLKQK